MRQNSLKDFYRIKLIHFTSWLIGIVLLLVIFLVLMSFSPKTDKNMTAIRLSGSLGSDSNRYETATQVSNTNTFIECDEFDIKHLIRNYYEALENGNREELAKYVDDVTGYTDEELRINTDYVEKYMDIQCYYMEGMMPGTYLVAVYSYVKYYGIHTTVPNIDKFYICSNASGKFYISKKDVGDEVSSYNELMFDNSQINEMYDMADREIENAKKYDSSIKALLEKLNGSQD